MTEWRQNVFVQLSAHTSQAGSTVANEEAEPEAARRASEPDEGDRRSPAGHDGVGADREATNTPDLKQDLPPIGDGGADKAATSLQPSAASDGVPRARRRRHEAVDPDLLLPAMAAVSAAEAAEVSDGVDQAEPSGDEEGAFNDDLPPGVLTPTQIVRGDPLRLPDDDTRRRGRKVQSAPRRGGMVAMDPETVSVAPAPESSPKSRETGVIVDVEATETTPAQPSSKGFRRWRRTRPFTAGLLSMLGGVIVAAGPVSLLHVVAFSQSSVPIGAAVGILIFIMGLLEWVFPFYALLTGSITVVLALVSLVVASFGGLLIGMLLSLVGGAMAVAWRPAQPNKQKTRKSKAPNLPNTPSASA
ncbi:DUF6114 domain-containing protein [Alicyclobacillus fructus]|uniref:DUF6114 domain-containing protein n=1 Tax=Alicyclobacillus fructus TaxID=2816082 RepID=UPI001F353EC7|nr:DUF6114 domain-containing protein [Alicyclobacillus fructus]